MKTRGSPYCAKAFGEGCRLGMDRREGRCTYVIYGRSRSTGDMRDRIQRGLVGAVSGINGMGKAAYRSVRDGYCRCSCCQWEW